MLWGGKFAGRNYPPTNKNTLIRALTEEWDKLPQQLLDNVVQTFQTTGTAVRKVGGGRPRTTTAGDDRYIILQAKRGQRQSASVIAQQRGDKCRGLLRPDAFTKEAYSLAVLNAASR
ncbi:uncharacterized protein TNCV_784261 [Trichonephila clavipes]|nr:uncharacterized protein TNCV_784261 [Trichonephila clavipes]